jgi:hypothetical protein
MAAIFILSAVRTGHLAQHLTLCLSIPFHVCYIQVESESADEEEPTDACKPPVVILQTFKKYGDPLALPRTLQAIKPRFVIMYDADMVAVRRLEVRMLSQVYQASGCDMTLGSRY